MSLRDALEQLNIKTLEELKIAKSKFFGPGSKIRTLQDQIKSASEEERQELGKKIKLFKDEADAFFKEKMEMIEREAINKSIKDQVVDVTVPLTKQNSLHPLTLVANRFREWFKQNSYYETKGSEIESDEFNFERLNIGKDHPARDMQDSLYITEQKLMRTHNTGFTAHELKKNPNIAFNHFTIGNVYRNDEDDQTHSHQFTQADFVAVGYFSFQNLIWTLKSLLSYVLEEDIEIRLRPSYFPFTEPSVEVDVNFKGKWMEVLGAGMLHRDVLKTAGYTNDMNGFAAGIGLERIAMMKYDISDIREFYRNDLRFLNQFKGGK